MQNPRDLGRIRQNLGSGQGCVCQLVTEKKEHIRVQRGQRPRRGTWYSQNDAHEGSFAQAVGEKYQIQKELEALLELAAVQREETTKRKVEGDQEFARLKERAGQIAKVVDLDSNYHAAAANLIFQQASVVHHRKE